MNSINPSPQNSASPSGSKLSKSQRDQAELSQKVSEILFASFQTGRTLWSVVNKAGGMVEINEAEADPLWDLRYEKIPGPPALLRILSVRLPELTDEHKNKLVEKLLGTDHDPGPVMDELQLSNYPKSYVVQSLHPYIVFGPAGRWITRAAFDALPKKQEPPPPTEQK